MLHHFTFGFSIKDGKSQKLFSGSGWRNLCLLFLGSGFLLSRTMDTRPIGMFDSGVGGLSIFAEVKKNVPRENLIFLADQANVPYGDKTKNQLKKLTQNI